jgi:hypothetical protein
MSDEQAAPAAASPPGDDVLDAIEARQGDAAFMGKYLNGDKQAIDEMKALYAGAFPEPVTADESAPDAPKLTVEGSSDPFDLAASLAQRAPLGPWEYPALFGTNQTADQTEGEMAMKQAFFDVGLPVATVNTLRSIGARIAQQGVGDPEKAITAGTRELEKRHGKDAPQVIALARAAFEHLDATHSGLGDALLNAGLCSDADAITALANWARAARSAA